MPSRRFAPIGNWPPSCKYLCTASRPVNTTPEMRTSSPTFSARILDSVNGSLSSIMSCRGRFLGDDQSPTGKSPPWPDRNDISRGSRRFAACICPRRSCDNAEIVQLRTQRINLSLHQDLNVARQVIEVQSFLFGPGQLFHFIFNFL